MNTHQPGQAWFSSGSQPAERITVLLADEAAAILAGEGAAGDTARTLLAEFMATGRNNRIDLPHLWPDLRCQVPDLAGLQTLAAARCTDVVIAGPGAFDWPDGTEVERSVAGRWAATLAGNRCSAPTLPALHEMVTRGVTAHGVNPLPPSAATEAIARRTPSPGGTGA